MDYELRDGERLDDLQYCGLMLLQRPDLYCFTSDAVLLANLAQVDKGSLVADFGSGSGIISVLVAFKRSCKVTAVEIQPVMAELTARNARLNCLSDSIDVKCMDIADAPKILGKGNYDCVICNPPYFSKGSGSVRLSPEVALSRHESSCDLKGIIDSAAAVLRPKGKLYMIHKVERMAEVIACASVAGIEPKSITLIYPKADKEADTFVICCVKGGKAGIKLSHITVYDSNGKMSKQAEKLYGKE
ncbi:MAG: methyltransferase [Clostridia bacterium]|nr:methyltransferase [Clostridia bacterium]